MASPSSSLVVPGATPTRISPALTAATSQGMLSPPRPTDPWRRTPRMSSSIGSRSISRSGVDGADEGSPTIVTSGIVITPPPPLLEGVGGGDGAGDGAGGAGDGG